MNEARTPRELDARAWLSDAHVATFWEKVDTSAGPDACWPWRGAVARKGYGVYGVCSKVRDRWVNSQRKAHRIAWSLSNGAIEAGAVVRHRCDNPPCCNPSHLDVGTSLDNVRDKVDRSRQSRGGLHSDVMRRVAARGEKAANAKLTSELVVRMRTAFTGGASTDAIAQQFEVSIATSYRVTRRKSWRHVP